MNKNEVILRKLSNIGLNNKILELEQTINLQKEKNLESQNKVKDLFAELVTNNKKLISEKKDLEEQVKILQQELNYNKNIINKIPKFLLRIFTKNKNVKLLNKGIDIDE